jgi:hypothetical protein
MKYRPSVANLLKKKFNAHSIKVRKFKSVNERRGEFVLLVLQALVNKQANKVFVSALNKRGRIKKNSNFSKTLQWTSEHQTLNTRPFDEPRYFFFWYWNGLIFKQEVIVVSSWFQINKLN